jgi:hypothetical protein
MATLLLFIRNPEEDINFPVHPNSLCAILAGKTLDFFCEDCAVPATFVAASAVDFALKQLEDDIYYRERLATAPPACADVPFATETGQDEGFTGGALVLDQWLPLSAAHCSGINSITGYHIELEDMPLNHAVYEPGRDVIYGVSGGYVYKLNATTGEKISSARFFENRFYDSYIAYSSITDKLYVTAWMNDPGNEPAAINRVKWMFKLNPDTLAVDGTFNIFASGVTVAHEYFESGPREMVSVAGDIYFLMFDRSQSNNACYLMRFDVAGETWDNSSSNNRNIGFSQGLTYDADNNVIWVSTQQGATAHAPAPGVTQSDTVDISGVSDPMAKGICYRSGHLYFTLWQGTTIERYKIQKVRISDDNNTTIDLGDTAATPRKIRYWSINDRIYVPTFNANTVVIIDPTTDTVESTKTGFDSPVDVVFTPTKVWAVQHGAQGLKEVI